MTVTRVRDVLTIFMTQS